jgi:hypothetical protein
VTDLDPQEEEFLKKNIPTVLIGKGFSDAADLIYRTVANRENDRAVKLLEKEAEEARKIGDRNIEQIYLIAAEKIRIR